MVVAIMDKKNPVLYPSKVVLKYTKKRAVQTLTKWNHKWFPRRTNKMRWFRGKKCGAILLKFEWNKWLFLSKVILYIPKETDTPNEDFLDSFVSTTSACFYDWDNYFLSLDSFSIAVSVHFDCNELSFHFAIMWTKGFQISAISKS